MHSTYRPAALVACLILTVTFGCGEPRLLDVQPESGEETGEASVDPDQPEDGITGAELGERYFAERRYVVAPWTTRFTVADLEGVTILDDRLVFPRQGNEHLLELQPKDILWAPVEEWEKAFARRLIDISANDDEIHLHTRNAQLHEIFMKLDYSLDDDELYRAIVEGEQLPPAPEDDEEMMSVGQELTPADLADVDMELAIDGVASEVNLCVFLRHQDGQIGQSGNGIFPCRPEDSSDGYGYRALVKAKWNTDLTVAADWDVRIDISPIDIAGDILTAIFDALTLSVRLLLGPSSSEARCGCIAEYWNADEPNQPPDLLGMWIGEWEWDGSGDDRVRRRTNPSAHCFDEPIPLDETERAALTRRIERYNETTLFDDATSFQEYFDDTGQTAEADRIRRLNEVQRRVMAYGPPLGEDDLRFLMNMRALAGEEAVRAAEPGTLEYFNLADEMIENYARELNGDLQTLVTEYKDACIGEPREFRLMADFFVALAARDFIVRFYKGYRNLGNFADKKDLSEKPIFKAGAYPIGAILVEPQLKFAWKFDVGGNLDVAFDRDLDMRMRTGMIGIDWRANEELLPPRPEESTFDFDGQFFGDPSFGGAGVGAKFLAYTPFAAKVKLFGVVGPALEVGPYAEVSASGDVVLEGPTCDLGLDLGVLARLTGEIGIPLIGDLLSNAGSLAFLRFILLDTCESDSFLGAACLSPDIDPCDDVPQAKFVRFTVVSPDPTPPPDSTGTRPSGYPMDSVRVLRENRSDPILPSAVIADGASEIATRLHSTDFDSCNWSEWDETSVFFDNVLEVEMADPMIIGDTLDVSRIGGATRNQENVDEVCTAAGTISVEVGDGTNWVTIAEGIRGNETVVVDDLPVDE